MTTPVSSAVAPGGAAPALAPPEKKEPSPEVLKAAREFEALLLRQVLESLEKTASVGGSKRATASAYQSMVVDALADGLSQAGGLGLSDLVARLLETEMGGGRAL